MFSGDTLFSLGCGRVFEGTYEQMFNSLQAINDLPDDTLVYCGHEYTLQNFSFLISVFNKHEALENYKLIIDKRLKSNNRTIPFNLADEKKVNPFLCSKITSYRKFMKTKNLNEFLFFKYIRDLKNNY